jgi:3-isopropylmalate/(R)-2-methylmalate dehydratase small subunit
MEAFKSHRGIAGILARANVDTDQIIPKQFLKSIERTGFGEALFFDWRYNDDGSDNPDFNLNAPRFKGASILVTHNNFGCGSSREHAVWAVLQYGFRVVIAPRRKSDGEEVNAFADIFRNNGFNNGLLTIELSEDEVLEIIESISRNEGLEITVNLEAGNIVLHTEDEKRYDFKIDETFRQNLLEGKDPIDQTLEFDSEITAFENEKEREIFSPGS